MYKFGKPTRKRSYKVWLRIFVVVLAIVAGAYLLFIANKNHTQLKNNNSPLVSKVSANQASITINEPLFTMDMPGQWKETARDTDPHYQSIQWNDATKNSAGRWVRIYVDTIPAEFALNYLQPVSASGNHLNVGQQSENCVTFTQGATPSTTRDVAVPNSQAVLPARWQAVSFMCDNSHVSHQVVGTGSAEGANAITISGPEHGQHKYFFVYEDDNYHPDYSVFVSILQTFKTK